MGAFVVCLFIYINSFKDEFNKEDLDKIVPVILVVIVLSVLFSFLTSLTG